MNEYLNILKTNAANAISAETENRGGAWLRFFLNLLWIGMVLILVEILFNNTKTIGGWDKPSVYLLTVFFMIVDEVFSLFFNTVTWIPEQIMSGHLDHALTKPVPSLFLLTVNVSIQPMYNLLEAGGLLAYVLVTYDLAISWISALAASLLLIGAVAILYAICLIVNTLAFWFDRIDNINDLIFQLQTYGRFPVTALPRALKILLLTIVPFGFIATVPAAIFTGRLPLSWGIYLLIVASIFLSTAILFWRVALKRYTSASS